ncbi:hypothetical protein Ahia01_001134500 [Argonauta hians]
MKTSSPMECASISIQKGLKYFTYDKTNKICINYSPKNIMTIKKIPDNNHLAFYKSSEWIGIYSVSMGANSLIYESLMNQGNAADWNVMKCKSGFCPKFFRHPIIDIWDKLSIQEVKLVIYKKQKPVITMVFDGSGSTSEDWFSESRLKSSPWKDLKKGSATNFAIAAGSRPRRRFYVINAGNGECDQVTGWLAIRQSSFRCDWEEADRYPVIFYSGKQTKTLWKKEREIADAMAIFISVKKS